MSELLFPLGGLHRGAPYRAQPPFTTPHARNVRPDDTIEKRGRGGSRPALVKAYPGTQLNSGEPVRLMNNVNIGLTDSTTSFLTDFSEETAGYTITSAGNWTRASWASHQTARHQIKRFPESGPPGIYHDSYYNQYGMDYLDAVYLTEPPAYVRTASVRVGLLIPEIASTNTGTYQLYVGFDADAMGGAIFDPTASPIVGTGVCFEFQWPSITNGTWAAATTYYVDGVQKHSTETTSGSYETWMGNGWLFLEVIGTGAPDGSECTINSYIRNDLRVCNATGVESYASDDYRDIGFGMASNENCNLRATGFSVLYNATAESHKARTVLVMSSGGDMVYQEETDHTITEYEFDDTDHEVNLAAGHALASCAHGGKLYITDYGNRDTGTGTVATATLTLEVAGNGTQFADHRYNAGETNSNYVAKLVYGGATQYLDIIGAAADTVTLSANPASGNQTYTYAIERKAKVYDPAANTLTNWAASTAGTFPYGCRLIAPFLNTVILGGHPDTPHIWYMPHMGDLHDFDYDAADYANPDAAIGGSHCDAGNIAAPVVAFMTTRADYIIIGCRSSLWLMRGHPGFGGKIHNVSRKVGVVGPDAWTATAEGGLLFLGRDGLYWLPPEPTLSTNPVALSQEKLPLALRKVDVLNNDVNLVYDHDYDGVHVYITPKLDSAGLHYWIAFRGGTPPEASFWEETYCADHQPTAAFYYHADEAAWSAMLVGGKDGYVRKYCRGSATDDGETVSSAVTYGPFFLGGGVQHEGVICDIGATMAPRFTGDVDWELYVGDTAEEALIATTAAASGTWSAGDSTAYNKASDDRASGVAAVLRLSSSAKWGIETVHFEKKRMGPFRPN